MLRRFVTPIALFVALATLRPQLSAQWLTYPSAGLPRTSTGAPDLTSPPPKGPDGRPDLSGIWKAEENRPCPPEGCDDMRINREFLDIGWKLPGGLPYQPWAE